jgi:hypothetical protein
MSGVFESTDNNASPSLTKFITISLGTDNTGKNLYYKINYEDGEDNESSQNYTKIITLDKTKNIGFGNKNVIEKKTKDEFIKKLTTELTDKLGLKLDPFEIGFSILPVSRKGGNKTAKKRD